MFDVAELRSLIEPLAWFMTLGKSDTTHIKSEIADLLIHAGASIRSLIEVEKLLASVKKEKDFNKQSFWKFYTDCRSTYTGDKSSELARTHCRDIQRDIRRIAFKTARFLRTEVDALSDIDKKFGKLSEADDLFLKQYGETLKGLGKRLGEVYDLLDKGNKKKAWDLFESIRNELHNDVEALDDVVQTLTRADDHIRKVLT